ncbi:hypothetical protein L873DRAFT_1817909, partial [Choiromyces venosus 120613-1]
MLAGDAGLIRTQTVHWPSVIVFINLSIPKDAETLSRTVIFLTPTIKGFAPSLPSEIVKHSHQV